MADWTNVQLVALMARFVVIYRLPAALPVHFRLPLPSVAAAELRLYVLNPQPVDHLGATDSLS